MRALIDTHALFWWLVDSERLSAAAFEAITDESNEVFVSAASAWELAAKLRLGRLPGGEVVAANIANQVIGQGFVEMAISIADAERAGRLPGHHRDPFDRMLVAQALARDLVLVSVDKRLDHYGIRRLW